MEKIILIFNFILSASFFRQLHSNQRYWKLMKRMQIRLKYYEPIFPFSSLALICFPRLFLSFWHENIPKKFRGFTFVVLVNLTSKLILKRVAASELCCDEVCRAFRESHNKWMAVMITKSIVITEKMGF